MKVHQAHFGLRPAGVEPTTFGSGGQRSIQLSYGRDEGVELATDLANFHKEFPPRMNAQPIPALTRDARKRSSDGLERYAHARAERGIFVVLASVFGVRVRVSRYPLIPQNGKTAANQRAVMTQVRTENSQIRTEANEGKP